MVEDSWTLIMGGLTPKVGREVIGREDVVCGWI